MSKQDDEARKKILARRATFVAAALAGVSTACGKEPSPPPQPCLSQVRTMDDGAAPEPCLSPPPLEAIDAGAPEPCLKVRAPQPDSEDGGRPVPMPCLTPVRPLEAQEADAGKPPAPQPCLSPKPPPKPCLKVMPPGSR